MIQFNGKEIFGTHDVVVEAPVELQAVRTYFWGLRGVSEILGGQGGRELSIYFWLHRNYSSRTSLEDAVKELNTWVGEHGTLIETDNRHSTTKVYENVTFTGLELQAIPGRESPGPIKDYVGTVDGGWFQAATFKFYQLVIPGDPNGATP